MFLSKKGVPDRERKNNQITSPGKWYNEKLQLKKDNGSNARMNPCKLNFFEGRCNAFSMNYRLQNLTSYGSFIKKSDSQIANLHNFCGTIT